MSARPPDGYFVFLPVRSFFSPLASCFEPVPSLVAEDSVDDSVAPLAAGPLSAFLLSFETLVDSVVFPFGAPRTSP